MHKNYSIFLFLFFALTGVLAQTTDIPDVKFEQALIDLGIDKDGVINGTVATIDISGITTLNVKSKEISDLTGIRDFSSLSSLVCSDNLLSDLDLTGITTLEEVRCFSNQLASIDVSGNQNLTVLKCYSNQLTSIDMSQNFVLANIDCNDNLLTSLDLGQSTNLTGVFCENNKLTDLDVNKNINLRFLYCTNNELTNLDLSKNLSLLALRASSNILTELDLSQNASLTEVNCQSNELESLNVRNGNNASITVFNASSNAQLTCIDVDNETDANAGTGSYGSWVKDDIASYSEDCGTYLGVDDESLVRSVSIYPNPVFDFLSVDSKIQINKVEIYSILGKKVKSVHSDFRSISLSNLTTGIYMIKIYSDNGSTTKKLIKM